MTEVLAIGEWRDNAEMFAAIATLGYLDGTVLDATYGEGTFWRDFRPELLVTNDLYKAADTGFDYRAMRWCGNRHLPDGWADVVVFDPPYKLSGTPALGEFDYRYGIAVRMSRDERLADIRAGALECYRVCGRILIVKCQDQVEGGRVRWQTDLITRAIEEAGGRKVDRFDLHYTPRPQPPGRRQITARRNHSTALVFEKPTGRSPR